MPRISLLPAILTHPVVVAGLLFAPAPASADVAVTQVSCDPFTDAQAQHRTEVEPDTFTFGHKTVTAFPTRSVPTGGSNDKNWIACDNTSTSPFFGNCYTEYDVTSNGNAFRMRTSSDGGLTWGPARATGDNASGLGGQPVVRPNGTVLVPFESGNQIRSF